MYFTADEQKDMQHWPFKTTRGDADRRQMEVQWRFYPEGISAMVLSKMREVAETQGTTK
jgi:molecular chaperone DnaK (HSP70)